MCLCNNGNYNNYIVLILVWLLLLNANATTSLFFEAWVIVKFYRGINMCIKFVKLIM